MVKKILGILFMVILCGVLIGFFKQKSFYSKKYEGTLVDRYGKGFNTERIQEGLPIIEQSWVVRVSDSSHVQWSHEAFFNTPNVPEHIWKTLYFKDSVLISEEDAFNYDQGDSVGDRLIAMINVLSPDSPQFKFSRHHYGSYPPSESFDVEYEFADSVLNAWGFKNYHKYFNQVPSDDTEKQLEGLQVPKF
jgi:hypothetical protein